MPRTLVLLLLESQLFAASRLKLAQCICCQQNPEKNKKSTMLSSVKNVQKHHSIYHRQIYFVHSFVHPYHSLPSRHRYIYSGCSQLLCCLISREVHSKKGAHIVARSKSKHHSLPDNRLLSSLSGPTNQDTDVAKALSILLKELL